MQIRTDSFCALSRNKDWRAWLRDAYPEMSLYLEDKLKSNKGCKSNKKTMTEIYKSIYSSGRQDLIDNFENLVSTRFPYIIESKKNAKDKKPLSQTDHIIQQAERYSNLDKHGVFKLYRPHILTLPCKLVMKDNDPLRLQKSVDNFIKDKVDPDYIILENRAYIEYMPPQFRKAEPVPEHLREIKAFRNKLKEQR